jgi:hypothetical protein
MKVYTLDNIVRSALADKGYPMHFYLQFLQYGIDAVRNLNFDVLRNVKSVRLTVNSYKAVTIPCDYVDFIRIGDELGQYINYYGEKDTYNRLNKFDASGNKIPYDSVEEEFGIPYDWQGFWGTTYLNSYGEFKGRAFNSVPTFPNSFTVIRERNEIQLDTTYTGTTITMDYITDGLTTDSTTTIHPYASETIKAYIFWKLKEHGRQYNLSERGVAKDEYYNALRILRARMNGIDTIDIRRSLSRAYNAAIKN